MSGRRAKQQRRRALRDVNRVVPAHSRAAWKDRLTAAGLLTGVLMPFVSTSALALPQGGNITSGTATISTPTGTSMRVDQTTDRLIMDWTRFNIAANESVRFQQPSAASIALNRVLGPEPSAIFGLLSANGQIFLINPSGILFGAGSRVDVGALTASTLNMTNRDFLAGQYRFTQDPALANAAVVNQGVITAGPGGYVALLGAATRNEGVIQAQLGSIVLAAGRAATLDMRGDGLIQFVVSDAVAGNVISPDGKSLASYVSNTGTLQADGGMVTLQAKAASDVIRSVVNQEGVVRATSLVNRGGVISLVANSEDGSAWNKGVLDVSAGEPGAASGLVTISAPYAGQSGTILAKGADGASGGHVEITSTRETGLFAGSVIDVSGVGNSNAGSVRAWSDNYTVFSPNALILARGGESGGNGGFAEVSGKEALNVAGFVDARAPYGATGTLLLDPHNITVATGGVGLLTDVDQFTDTPVTDVTIAPATINAAGANVVLQANNDITFTNAVSIAGAGIGLTAQAGRAIVISASITTNNAPISLTANETTANGVVNANRDAGTAVITMAAGTSLTSGGSNITFTMNTGAGLTNSTSGNITLEGVNAGAGNVLVVNNGPTAASGIVRASANELITATSAALDVNGAGGGGTIATLAAPIRVSVNNLEARSQSLGAYFTSPTLAVNIGGATLGGLTGISTSSNGILSVTTTGTSITTTEALSANGSGTVTLTAAGAASSITANDALSSVSGAITLTAANGITLSGATADVTTTGAYTANADSDSNGTGVYTQNNAGSAVASGAVIITAQDVDLQGTLNAGAAAVTVRTGLLSETIGVDDASKQFNITNAELSNISTTGTVTVGIATNTGGITIGTDGAVNQSKALTFLSTGNIVLGANGLTDAGAVTMTTSGTGAITLNGALATTGNKNIALTTANAAITDNSTINAAGSGTVVLTAAGAVNGAITVNSGISSGSGAITVTAPNGVTLSGTGSVSTTGAYSPTADNDSNGTGVYTQAAGSTVSSGAVTLSAQDIDLQGTLNAGAAAVTLRPGLLSETIGVADASKQFSLTDAELSNITTTGTLTIGQTTNTGGITIGTDGAINQTKILTFTTAGPLSLGPNGLTTTGAVNLTTTSTTTPITVTGPINAGAAAVTLTANNGITLSGANADVTTTGAYTAIADNDANGTGLYSQNNAGSAVTSGTVSIRAADIDLVGTLNAGAAAVTLRPEQLSATIGVADASKSFNLTDAELSNITTTGTLTIGQTTNTGGITIGTDGAVNQNKALTFLSTGNIVLAANGLTDAGAVTMTTSGTGAITLNGALATTGNKNIALTTTNAAITTTGTINAAGSGTISLTAAGAANGSMTLTNAITSGSGAVTLTAANGITLSGASADVTTTGAYAANADSDSNGTGIYSQNNAGSAVSTGAVTITAQDIDLQGTLNAGAAAVTLRPGLLSETIGVADASKQFSLTDAELSNITTTGTLTIGQTTNTGGITIGTDGAINQTKILTFTTAGPLSLGPNGLTTTGAVNLTTTSTTTPITVTGPINAGAAAVTLTANNGITLSGANADVTTTGAYTAIADNDANGTGLYSQNNAGSAVTSGTVSIRAADIDLVGTLNAGAAAVTLRPEQLSATIGVADASKSFNLTDAELSNITTTGTLTIGQTTNTGGITIGTDGAVNQNKALTFLSTGNIVLAANGLTDAGAVTMTTSGTGAITLNGALATTGNKNIALTTTNAAITTTGTINAAGSGTISLTAAGAANGSMTLTNAITSGSGAVTLTAANGITLSGASADVTTTGAYAANADSDSNGTGIYSQNNAGSAVSTGAVTITAQDIDLQGTLNAGAAAVTLRPGLLSETIGVADASKQFSLTDAELSNITTTGTLTIGQTTNTGGITIGTDAAVNQNKALTFLSTGNILLAANGLTDAGAVTMTTSGTGAITLNGPLATTGNKNIALTTTNAAITTNGIINAGGSGTVVLTAAGAVNGSLTVNNAISSGSGLITLTAPNGITLGGSGSVTTTGAYTATADNDLNGTGVYTQTAGSSVFSGAATVIAADVDLQGTLNAGAAAVTLRPGLLSETIGVADASKQFSLTDAELSNITTTGTLTIGQTTNTGGITIGTDAAVNQNKALTFLSTGNILLAANGLTDAGAVTMTTSGTGAITLNGPLATTGNKNIALTTTNAAITTNGIINAGGSGTVVLTAAGAVNGSLTVNNAISSGSGLITLTAPNGITLGGSGSVTTTGAYTATADNDLNGTGVYTQTAGSSVFSGAATVIAADVDLQGTLNAGAAAVTLRPGLLSETIGVADASKQFSLTDAELSNITTTGTLTIGQTTNTGGITIGTDAAVNQNKALTFLSTGNILLAANGLTDAGAVTMTTSGTGAITLNGPLATTGNKNIALTTTNAAITTNGIINAGGSGTVVLTAAGAVNGSLTVNNAISSGSGLITLTAPNGITLGGSGSVTTTGAYTATADNDLNGTGVYTQTAGSSVFSGAATVIAADVDLQGTLNAGAAAVTLRPGLLSETIGVADASKQFSLTDAELSNITTTGTLTIGQTTNTGGITIGTDAAVNQNKALTFLSTGNILLAANGLTDAGAVTMTTSGTGAITLNGPLATTGNKNIALTTTNAAITTNGIINAGGSGTVVLTAAGAVNGSLTVNNAISSGSGLITLTAPNGITLGGSGSVTTTGAYTATADNDLNGTGVYTQTAGSSVFSGAATVIAADVDLQGTLNAGAAAVTLRPGLLSETIGVADASKQFSLTDAELSNITTTGTLTIGQTTNTGGITIGTDAAVNQNKALTFLSTGNILLAANGLTDAGAVTMTTSGTGAITLNGPLATTGNKNIALTTTNAAITTNGIINAGGSGTVVLTAAGAVNGSLTVNNAISSGSGLITLTAPNGITLGGSGSVTTTGAYTATADNDLNGTGVYTQTAGSSVFSGAATVIAADVDLQGTLNAGAAAVTLRPGLLSETIGVADASKQFSLTDAELSNITTTGTLTIGQTTNTGGITIGTDAAVNQNKALTFLSTGNILLAANGLTDAGAVTMTTSGTGAITLNGPLATTGNKNIALTTTNAAITTNGIINAGGSGTVVLTAAGAVNGSLTVNNAISSGSGLITLTAPNGITLGGSGSVTTTGAYTATADNDLNGTGVYTQTAGSSVFSGAATVIAADVDLQGTLNAGAAAVTLRPGLLSETIGVADASKQFSLTDAELSNITTTGTLTIGQTTNTGGITIGTDAAVNQNKALTFLSTGNILLAANGLTDAGAVTMTTSGTGAITLNGPLATTGNKNIALTTTNAAITTNGIINAGGSGTVVLTAAGAVNGSLTVNNAISSGSGLITLTAPNGITLGGSGSVTTTGAYTATADNDLNGTGVYTQTAGSSVFSGAATVIAADVDLQGTLNAGAAAVTLRPGLLSETIGVADASKQFSLTDAELSNITTTGTLTIGQTTNTGGITIGTDAAVNQNKALTFLSTGNILLAANGLTDAGAVTMTTSGTGAITLNGPLATTGNKNIALTTTNAAITTNGIINAGGSGTVVLTAAGAVNGSLTVNNAISSGSGLITLTAPNGITLGGSGSVTTTGAYTATADNDLNGTGVYTQTAGSSVFSGAATVIAADVDLQGTLNAGAAAVTLRPGLLSETIGVADASKQFSLTDAELSNITTTGTLTIGQTTNTGGITIGTDAAVNQNKALTFLSTGNILLAANGLTDAGAVTMTTSGTGAITLNGPLATTNQAITLNAGTRALTQNAGATISAGSGAISLTADSIALGGGPNSISGTSTILLQPASAGRPIVIGAPGTATDFALDTSEIAALTDGFSSITIGQSSGSGVITVNAVTFNDPVMIRAPSGRIIVDGPITGTGNASIFLDSSQSVGQQITLNAGITTAGQLISLDNVVLGADVTLDTTNAGASPAGANITFRSTTIDADSAANNRALTLTAGTGGDVTLPNAVGGTQVLGALTVSSGNTASLKAVTTRDGGISVTASGITLNGNLISSGAVSLTASGAITGTGTLTSGSTLNLNASSVGTAGTPVILGTVSGQLSGTLSGTALTDVFNVKSATPSTINLGLITATSGGIGHPVTIDSTGGSILHVKPGTDIDGGRVNFWGTTIGQNQFDLQVTTNDPPVFCNGSPCGVPYFVNGSSALFGLTNTTLPDNVQYLLAGVESQDAQLLTAGVLPKNLYNCLNLDRKMVVCTAGTMWHDDDGDDGPALKPSVQDDPFKAEQPVQRISVPQKSKATSHPGRKP